MLLDKIQSTGPQRRWYEQDPGFSRLLLLMKKMEQDKLRRVSIRLLLNNGRYINQQITTMVASQPIDMPDGRSRLAPDQNRRQTDSNPDLRRFYDTLYSIPAQGLTAVGFNLTDTFELLLTYSMSCRQMQTVPQPQEILNMIRIGLHEGIRTSQTSLKDYIGEDLFQELSQTTT